MRIKKDKYFIDERQMEQTHFKTVILLYFSHLLLHAVHFTHLRHTALRHLGLHFRRDVENLLPLLSVEPEVMRVALHWTAPLPCRIVTPTPAPSTAPPN